MCSFRLELFSLFEIWRRYARSSAFFYYALQSCKQNVRIAIAKEQTIVDENTKQRKFVFNWFFLPHFHFTAYMKCSLCVCSLCYVIHCWKVHQPENKVLQIQPQKNDKVTLIVLSYWEALNHVLEHFHPPTRIFF